MGKLQMRRVNQLLAERIIEVEKELKKPIQLSGLSADDLATLAYLRALERHSNRPLRRLQSG